MPIAAILDDKLLLELLLLILLVLLLTLLELELDVLDVLFVLERELDDELEALFELEEKSAALPSSPPPPPPPQAVSAILVAKAKEEIDNRFSIIPPEISVCVASASLPRATFCLHAQNSLSITGFSYTRKYICEVGIPALSRRGFSGATPSPFGP
ncbi:hypothetical protein ACDA63_18730 [Uliginosibacterium sp. sgz301328]|uniref:hypothetical protein n=1 Tax=Uliginosibacterium sp. sgz301328 TaxID=3243764 RepID=UPI00359DFBD2